MQQKKGLTIYLDESALYSLEQLKRQIDVNTPKGGMPPFTIPALARHAIIKWCDHMAAPVPYRHEVHGNSED